MKSNEIYIADNNPLVIKSNDRTLDGKIHVAKDRENQTPLKSIEAEPFQGGCNTVLEAAQIPMGGYSMVQNMRGTHPGFKQRKGQRAQHTEANSTATVLNMAQFSKGRKDENHFYAQWSDDDVWDATTAPPGVTTGVFGTKVFTGSANSVPGSFAALNDILFFSNGVDQHQVYPGTTSYVTRFLVYVAAAAIPTVPILGKDYSDEVSDGLTTTAAILDSLSTLAAFDCVFIGVPVPIDTLTWTISKANGTASVAQMKYRKSDDSWAAVASFTDSTSSDSKTLATTGATMTWTLPTDSIPSYMFGECMYWYQLSLASGALDAEVEVTSVTFGTDWQSIENIWDSVPVPVIETQFFDHSVTAYKTFGSVSIEIDSMTSDDKLYFASFDKINAVYVDVGTKPSTAGKTVNAVYYCDGSTPFTSVGTITDGTAGLSHSGWITFPRKDAQRHQFNSGQRYLYWYYLTVSGTLNDDVIISLSTQPYFDISKYGKGRCCAPWKGRMVYGFDKDQFLYASALNRPQVLNGDDGKGILEPGDGRSNPPVAMVNFHNELMVFQQEKGKEGGCITLFEGFSPFNFGKVLISTSLGTMNAKSVAVVDGSKLTLRSDFTATTITVFLSRSGVFFTDGTTPKAISGDIQNYFDPLESVCIRRGYENQMWLAYDSAYNVIRIGLVSGSSATTCNVFPVFDLTDGSWYFDDLEQALSCMTEVSAGSGNVPVVQMAGGTGDGLVYQSNYGDNDVTTKIDAYVDVELNGLGVEMDCTEVSLGIKPSQGGCVITPYQGTTAQTAVTVPTATERAKYEINIQSRNGKIRVQNDTKDETIHLYDMGYKVFLSEGR